MKTLNFTYEELEMIETAIMYLKHHQIDSYARFKSPRSRNLRSLLSHSIDVSNSLLDKIREAL